MRAFLAIKVPDEVKSALASAQSSIERAAPGFFTWSKPDQLHLTLYFLGDIDDSHVAALEGALSGLAGEAFSLRVSGLTFFPAPNIPKVVSAGFSGDNEPLRRFQQRVADTVFPIAAFKETRGFLPHVTLGRLKRGMPGTAKVLKKALAAASVPETPSFEVHEYELIKSTLSSGGPTYETIRSFTVK